MNLEEQIKRIREETNKKISQLKEKERKKAEKTRKKTLNNLLNYSEEIKNKELGIVLLDSNNLPLILGLFLKKYTEDEIEEFKRNGQNFIDDIELNKLEKKEKNDDY